MFVLSLVAMLGAIQGLLLLVLIVARFRCPLNLPFALLLLRFSIRLGSIPAWTPQGVLSGPWLLTLIGPLPLLFGPLVWWYVRNLVYAGKSIPRYAVAHALPWLVETVVLSLYVYSLDHGDYRALVSHLFSGSLPWWMTARHVVKILHGAVYAVIAARIAFGRESHEQVREKPRLVWARIVVLAPLISLFAFAVVALPPTVTVPSQGEISPFVLPALVMMVTVYGFAAVILFAPNVLAVGFVGDAKRNGCTLDEDEIRDIAAAVQRKLDSGAYHEPDLTVVLLAEELKIHPRRLSSAINHAYRQNFSQLVSGRRLDYFMERVSAGDLRDRNILDLAFEAGFSSKSTFNRVFKARYGSAPSTYLETHRDTKIVEHGE